jgi:hypothetical protein
MEYSLDILFDEIRKKHGAVNIDLGNCLRTIYKGVLMTKCNGVVEIFCTSSEYYRPVQHNIYYYFISKGLDAGVRAYQIDKYQKMIRRFKNDERTRKIFEEKLKWIS